MRVAMSHIFVSHATADHPIVNKICDELEKKSIQLWVDHRKGIPIGENWTSVIQQAVHTCDAGLLVLSKASAASDWCDKECTRILGLKKPLYIVMIEPMALEEIPIQYANIQYLDQSESLDRLDELVEAIIGKKPLDESDPAVKKIKRITGRIDRTLTAIPLQGRADALAACIDGLREMIVGVGGKGKSRLAAEVALTAEIYNGIVWHYAQTYYTADDLLANLREHLGLEAAADERVIMKKLREDKTLLVVDNAESITNESRMVYVEVLENAFDQGSGVLITTKERWGNLDPAKVVPLDELSLRDAEALVLEMGRVYGVTADLSVRASEIAAEARKHPRLIETAVKQTLNLPLKQVLSNLRDLKGDDFEKAMKKMIGVSFTAMIEKAGDAPMCALRRLSVTRGGFTYEAAMSLCVKPQNASNADDSAEETMLADEEMLQTVLATLADWQFCRLGSDDRYRLDPLAAEVAERELMERMMTPNPYHMHYKYYTSLAYKVYDANYSPK
jgi:hypothetical protein